MAVIVGMLRLDETGSIREVSGQVRLQDVSDQDAAARTIASGPISVSRASRAIPFSLIVPNGLSSERDYSVVAELRAKRPDGTWVWLGSTAAHVWQPGGGARETISIPVRPWT